MTPRTNSLVYPHAATCFAAISGGLFAIIGITGNLITIWALLNSPKMRSHATTAFVLSLCISDFLFCSISLPLTAVRYLMEAWIFGDTLCKIFPVIFYGNVAVSLLSMVGITINRYILISWNSIYTIVYQCKYIVLQLILVWGISFAMMMPPYFGIWGELGLDEATFSCTILKKDGKSIKKFLFLIGFLIPCVIIIISYSCIYITVRRQKQKLKVHRSLNGNSNDRHRSQEDNRLTIMMLTIFLAFLLCFLPLMLANVIDNEKTTQYPWFHIIASIMAWASSVINPFIYAASNRNYRVAYHKVFSKIKFWGDPMSPMASKTYHQSRNSKDFSNVVKSLPKCSFDHGITCSA